MYPHKTIGRLSLYRRLLYALLQDGTTNVHSHELARLADATAAQVRRDLMAVGCSGTPKRGYDVRELVEGIGALLDAPKAQGVALVGVGNLGRALLAYFSGRRPRLWIAAAFDVDPSKVNRLIHGCRCYPIEDMNTVIKEKDIRVGVVAVPAREAQKVAHMLVRGGVRGIMNFAPIPLHVPAGIYVENVDMTMSLEKVAYFGRHSDPEATRGS